MGKQLFITVGTTLFEKLMTVISEQQREFLEILAQKGFSTIVIQYGRGKPPHFNNELTYDFRIGVISYDYKSSLDADIQSSDLIISHAGAGTCLEVLSKEKPLIVVVNDSLMHNHQTELANQLTEDNHCLSCTPDTLIESLKSVDRIQLNRFPPGNPQMVVDCLNDYFGF